MQAQKSGNNAGTEDQLKSKTVKKPEVCHGRHKKTS